MRSLSCIFDNLERYIVIAITSIMTVSLFLQVVSRYVFNFSITWSEELSVFLLIWLTYYGASIAVRQRKHLRITMLVELLPARIQPWVDIACNVVFFGFMAFIAYGTWNMMALAKRTGQTAAATGIPRWIIIAGLLFAYILTMIRLIQDTRDRYREMRENEVSSAA